MAERGQCCMGMRVLLPPVHPDTSPVETPQSQGPSSSTAKPPDSLMPPSLPRATHCPLAVSPAVRAILTSPESPETGLALCCSLSCPHPSMLMPGAWVPARYLGPVAEAGGSLFLGEDASTRPRRHFNALDMASYLPLDGGTLTCHAAPHPGSLPVMGREAAHAPGPSSLPAPQGL